MKEVECELVQYDRTKLFYASSRFLYMFAAYSDIPRTEHFTDAWGALKTVIDNQEPTEIHLKAAGMTVIFSGFKMPLLRAEFNDSPQPKLVVKASEPFFFIQNEDDGLLPSERTHYQAVTTSIMEEMRETYKVAVETDPAKLIFPKQVYATEIVTESAYQLDPMKYKNIRS